MIRIPTDGILYHGSYTSVPSIDLSLCRRGNDFGRGFYLTSSFDHAVSQIRASIRQAKRRGEIPADYPESDGKGSVFRFHPNPNLYIHCFDDADEEWLHFVAHNRNSQLFVTLRKKYASTDIVAGKAADDQTALVLNNYVTGAYGVPGTIRADRMAIELLGAGRLKDQFCFRSDEAIASLEYLGSDSYGDVLPSVSREQKETSAIAVIRCMLLALAEEQHIPFQDALLSFAQSKTYENLFDFNDGIWREGPDYLRDLYEEKLQGLVLPTGDW